MQSEPVAKFSSPCGKFFLLGAVAELLVIACSFLPESWLAVETHNFTLVMHIPLLVLLESGLGETAPTAILTFARRFRSDVLSLGTSDCSRHERNWLTSEAAG